MLSNQNLTKEVVYVRELVELGEAWRIANCVELA